MELKKNIFNKLSIKYSEVLVVDDVPLNQKLISEILSQNNIKVRVASSGKEALESIDSNSPDLILLDISMPEMDGFTVCEILKSKQKTKNIPVIFLTARTQTEDIVKGFNVGAIDYLTKPFKSQELISRVITHIELKRSRDLIEKQNLLLKQKSDQIFKSLTYAKHIQEKIMPSFDIINENLPGSFVLFKPKQLVSGDFYWFSKHDNKIFIIVADCTGHGVPGGLLSMIGNTLLNEIINKNKIFTPSEILNNLYKNMIDVLNHGSANDEFFDEDMDISICCIDFNSNEFTISSSNQNVYIVKNKTINTVEGEIFSSGLYYLKKHYPNFKNNVYKIEQSTIIYMVTDGFHDQFGGPENKKFQLSKLKNLLLNCSEKNMNEQKNYLENYFNNWKGNNEQTDDLLIIGFKLG
ncbi:MAG: response regulator [Bacteroidales bacterium]|nr:response regulator [Bacteroidales bacterium]